MGAFSSTSFLYFMLKLQYLPFYTHVPVFTQSVCVFLFLFLVSFPFPLFSSLSTWNKCLIHSTLVWKITQTMNHKINKTLFVKNKRIAETIGGFCLTAAVMLVSVFIMIETTMPFASCCTQTDVAAASSITALFFQQTILQLVLRNVL